MKKIIFSVLTVLFSVCMFIPLMSYADEEYDDPREDPNRGEGFSAQDAWCYADNNQYEIRDIWEKIHALENDSNKLNDIENAVNSIDLKKDMDDYFNERAEENAKNNEDKKHPINSLTDFMIEVIEEMWGLLPDYIKGENKILDSYTLNIKNLKNTDIYAIFVNVGYSLVLVFFAANLIENSIKYEIFTLKGGAILFGRLIISKVIIDLSGTVCIYILNICTNISAAVFGDSKKILEWSIPTIGEVARSDLWLVGEIVDWIMTILLIIPILVIALAMIVAAAIIMVKLVLRSLELSLLVIVSPAFFACYSSEITKPYFKNFITTFIQCAVQIVFMSVVYFIGTNFLVSASTPETSTELFMLFVSRSQVAIIALAIAIMMVKPPKILTNLIK